jgi:tetratricopeptide (TPR) repeat protein
VYLLNGTHKLYTVAINGAEKHITPGAPIPVRVAEGDVLVESRDPAAPFEPLHCQVETPFFSRPFAKRTFVINPDQLAILAFQEVEYAAVPRPSPPPQFHLDRVVHAFEGVDYEFTPFPPTVRVEGNQSIKKTGVAVVTGLTPVQQLGVASSRLADAHQTEYVKRLLQWDTQDIMVLYWLLTRLKDDEAIEFLRPGLAARPLRVAWHRAFQDRMAKAHPDHDLRKTYRDLVAKAPQDPDALYLLARVIEDDPDQAEKLLLQAAAAKPPSAYAMQSLGFRALAQGQMPDAIAWTEKALRQDPVNPMIRHWYRQALLAGGKFSELLASVQAEQSPEQKYLALVDQLNMWAVKGDEAKARATIQQVLQLRASPNDPETATTRARLEVVWCCARNDVPAFLKKQAEIPKSYRFEAALLKGNLKEAAGLVEHDEDHASVHSALLFLAARKAGDRALADQQWTALLASLTKTRGESRHLAEVLAGRSKASAEQFRRMAIEPDQKRVLLLVAADRFPDQSKELVRLARTLNFSPDPTALCLRRFLS